MTNPKPSFVQSVRDRVAEVVVGQDTVVERMMIALLLCASDFKTVAPGVEYAELAFGKGTWLTHLVGRGLDAYACRLWLPMLRALE